MYSSYVCIHCHRKFEAGEKYYEFPGFPLICEDCIEEFAKTMHSPQ